MFKKEVSTKLKIFLGLADDDEVLKFYNTISESYSVNSSTKFITPNDEPWLRQDLQFLEYEYMHLDKDPSKCTVNAGYVYFKKFMYSTRNNAENEKRKFFVQVAFAPENNQLFIKYPERLYMYPKSINGKISP